MNDRLAAVFHGVALAFLLGVVLHVGKAVFAPVALGFVVLFVIAGLARLLERVPLLGPRMPLGLRYALSVVVIAFALFEIGYVFVANIDHVVALAPQYQQSLLATIQRAAAWLNLEQEPTWTTLHQDLFSQINLQRLLGTTVASLSSLLAAALLVALYAAFLLIERSSFTHKLALAFHDPRSVERIGRFATDIDARIGSYLALKTLLGVVLGLASYVVMRWLGLDFAAFWAVLIALLNYVPYVGSILGVALPVMMAIVQFTGGGDILTLLIALSVIQFVIGNVVDPVVMAKSLNLSPFAILLSLAAWTELWGVTGAFLAVPLTACLTIVLSSFPGTRPVAVLLSKDGRV